MSCMIVIITSWLLVSSTWLEISLTESRKVCCELKILRFVLMLSIIWLCSCRLCTAAEVWRLTVQMQRAEARSSGEQCAPADHT